MADEKQATESMWTCCGDDVFDDTGIIAHLRQVHGLQSLVATVQPVLSTGCAEWNLSTFEVKVGDLTLYRSMKTLAVPA